MTYRGWLVAMGVAGCGPTVPPEVAACQSVCTELMSTCGFDAYPSYDSCLTGCANEVEEGHDIFAKEDCVFEADCNLFDLLDCEHPVSAE